MCPHCVRMHCIPALCGLLHMECCSERGSPETCCSGFLLGLHFIGIIDSLPTWLISISRLSDTVLPRSSTLYHIIDLGVALPALNNTDAIWPAKSLTQKLLPYLMQSLT